MSGCSGPHEGMHTVGMVHFQFYNYIGYSHEYQSISNTWK